MRIERWFELAGWTDGRAKGEARDRDLVQGMAASPRRVLQMPPRRTVHRPALGICVHLGFGGVQRTHQARRAASLSAPDSIDDRTAIGPAEHRKAPATSIAAECRKGLLFDTLRCHFRGGRAEPRDLLHATAGPVPLVGSGFSRLHGRGDGQTGCLGVGAATGTPTRMRSVG